MFHLIRRSDPSASATNPVPPQPAEKKEGGEAAPWLDTLERMTRQTSVRLIGHFGNSGISATDPQPAPASSLIGTDRQIEARMLEVLEGNSMFVRSLMKKSPLLEPGPEAPPMDEKTAKETFLRQLRRSLCLRPDVPLELSINPVDASTRRTTVPTVWIGGVPHEFVLSTEGKKICEATVSSSLMGGRLKFALDALPLREPSFEAAFQTKGEILRFLQQESLASLNLPAFPYGNSMRYLDDPGLRLLAPIREELEKLRLRPERKELVNELLGGLATEGYSAREPRMSDLSANLSRLLVSRQLAATPENIAKGMEDLQRLRTERSEVKIFEGRSIVIAAADELSRRSEGSSPYRFGLPELVRGIQENSPASLSLHRAISSPSTLVERALLSTPYSPEIFGASGTRPRPGEILATAELHRKLNTALGNAPDTKLRIDLARGEDSQINIKIFREGTSEMLYEGKGKLEMSLFSRLPRSFESVETVSIKAAPSVANALSADSVKKMVLHAIQETPPGPNGFTFVFDGHGLPDGLCLGGGNGWKNSKISPEELVQAIQARQAKFGEKTKDDLYCFQSCFAHDFAVSVGKQLGKSDFPPLLYSTTEYGQYGYSQGVSTTDMTEILSGAAQLKEVGQSMRLRNVIQILQKGLDQSPGGSNPTLFLPDRTSPSKENRKAIYHSVAGLKVDADSAIS